jgi:hypothetical protein
MHGSCSRHHAVSNPKERTATAAECESNRDNHTPFARSEKVNTGNATQCSAAQRNPAAFETTPVHACSHFPLFTARDTAMQCAAAAVQPFNSDVHSVHIASTLNVHTACSAI